MIGISSAPEDRPVSPRRGWRRIVHKGAAILKFIWQVIKLIARILAGICAPYRVGRTLFFPEEYAKDLGDDGIQTPVWLW